MQATGRQIYGCEMVPVQPFGFMPARVVENQVMGFARHGRMIRRERFEEDLEDYAVAAVKD